MSYLRACLSIGLLAIALAATSQADNSMNVILARTDDFLAPSYPFAFGIEISVPDVVGITAIDVAVSGGGSFALHSDDPGRWSHDARYADLAAMQADFDGAWTINISGTDPSSSSFTLQANLLQDSDFFATATGLNPPNGAVGVSPNSIVSWVPPASGASADGLFVRVDGNSIYQDDNSVLGGLSTSDTSWGPPQPLASGQNEYSVGYYNIDDSFITALSVLSGSIIWGASEFVPTSYASQTPLLALGSETIVSFTVAPEPNSLFLLACGGLGGLVWHFRKRRRFARTG